MRERIEIGYVARAHGVRGEIRVVPHDPASTALSRAEEIAVGGDPFTVVRMRRVQGGFLLVLDGVADRERAEELRGLPVEVERSLIPLEPGEVILADLVGCDVLLSDGRSYGVVAGIASAGQDLLVIHDGEVERLLPYVPAFVKEVDVAARKLVVEPPAGLPEEPIPGR